jgi:hypothetical protein
MRISYFLYITKILISEITSERNNIVKTIFFNLLSNTSYSFFVLYSYHLKIFTKKRRVFVKFFAIFLKNTIKLMVFYFSNQSFLKIKP